MGQSSISMLNKVGYSMYWKSMWDNKVMFNRFLKEDDYLNDFFSLIFNDNISKNIFNLKVVNLNLKKYNYNYQFSEKLNLFLKNYANHNKLNCFFSRIWVLKYQKWLIVYNFVYLINAINAKDNFSNNLFDYKFESNNLLNYYFKTKKNFYVSYNLFNKNIF